MLLGFQASRRGQTLTSETYMKYAICRLTLDENDISKATVDTSEEDGIFSMELGEPEQAPPPRAFTPKARARTLINITATSAPPLA